MGHRREQLLALSGVDLSTKSTSELKEMFKDALENGMHGLCSSFYVEGQQPGDVLTEEQIRRRLNIMKPYTNWIRTFSCTEGNELIPEIAKEMGMKTLVGAWLGDDYDKNEDEIKGLIQLTKKGLVDVAAVGNEVMYRKELTEDELLDYLLRVKKEIPEVPVGYVDAYYEFTHKPRITEACDIILANCYPYWEGCGIDYSLVYMKQMYFEAKDAAKGKKVIITETGWPSQGESLGGAVPSGDNFMKYFINTQLWSEQEEIDIFFFSSFDESWKVGSEGDVGAYWGIWDKDENLKF